MDINDIAGTDRTGVVEISRVKVRRIESAECSTFGVAAGDVKIQAESRPGGDALESVSDGRRKRPCEDVVVVKPARLNNRLNVVVKSAGGAEKPCAKRLPHFVSRTVGVLGLVV